MIRALVIAALVALGPMRTAAAPPAPLPAEVYGRLPNIDLLRLSPSGQRLAYIAVAGDRTQLVVKDLSGAVLISTPVGETKVRQINWAGDDHLLVGVSTAQYLFREQGEYAQTLVVNLPAKKTFWVFADSQTILHSTYGYDGAVSNAGQWYGYFEGIRILKSRGFDPTLYALSYADLYRVNLDTGASDLVADGHQRPYAWAVDASGAVIAHSEYQQGGGDWTLRRDRPNPDILTTVRAPLGDIALGGLGRSPGTVVIDQPTPEEWNLADGAHTPLPVASDRPIEGYLFDPTSHQLVGVTVNEDRPEQEFFQPTLKARQAALRKALGASTWIVSWSADFQRLVLYTDGDGDAGTYWLAAGKSVSPYGYAYPEIPDASVGPQPHDHL